MAKLTAGDAQAGDFFGVSVSISGDYAVVGAYGEDEGGGNAGAAYIYYRDEGGADTWGQVAKLTAKDPDIDDYFGVSVSISGDYAIVGAWYEDAGGINAGAAYIHYRDEGGADMWGEVTKIAAGDAEAGDYFGVSVSISGDYAVVGAYGEDDGGYNAGAAYIFYNDQDSTDTWGQAAKLTAGDAAARDNFGHSVSISGDYAIVGAIGEDTGDYEAGAAYVFYKNQGGEDNWSEVAKLTAGDAQSSDFFGHSVSISGDYAAVGAWGEDTGGSNAGAAYIFHKDEGSTNNWGQVTKLMANDAGASDFFGFSVSISGDLVNSIVGAFREDQGGSDAGTAYMFKSITTGIEEAPEVSDVAIYPEIADDIITVEYNGIYNNLQASIYSIDGRKLTEQNLNGEINVINISTLIPGTYFIYVVTPDGPVARKFIKQ